MSRLSFNWLKAPSDRDIIRKWTPAGDHDFELLLPQPPDPEHFEFLALGDTGDSEPDTALSPQDAVARCLAESCAGPVGAGAACLVLHTGDVVYMTGERRLYERNFRRPYASFLTAESTVENLVFRLPFLPVPGNHDYYDFARWARLLVRTPVVGSGVRAVARELFTYRVPEGGSGMGRTFMEAFVNGTPPDGPLRYQPGAHTRIPNRYYQARFGSVDFFALDSNTLEPPPPSANPARVRREAARRVRELEEKMTAVERELKRDQDALERFLALRRASLAASSELRARLIAETSGVHQALLELDEQLQLAAADAPRAREAAAEVGLVGQVWARYLRAAERTTDPHETERLLDRLLACFQTLEDAAENADAALAGLGEGAPRDGVEAARDKLGRHLGCWEDLMQGELPPDLCGRLRTLSEAALDGQRELARERRRMHYREDDFDSAQLRWLDRALQRSVAERPDAWRIVLLHHPLYTTTGNHCEHADIQGVRDNLSSLLQGRVHLILAGHSHAFEWIRSRTLPQTGLFVTGGGGQVSLRRSVLAPERFPRYRGRYESLRAAGALESIHAGRGPEAADGAGGALYHFLRVEVTPEALRVRPVGVRRLRRNEYRREEPMPVYHVPEFTPAVDGAPFRERRVLEAVEIRRGQPPLPVWT